MNTKLKLYFGLHHEYCVKILKNRAFRSIERGYTFHPVLFEKQPLFSSTVIFHLFFNVSLFASSNNDIGGSPPSDYG